MSTTFDVHAAGYDVVAESPLGMSYRNRVRELIDRAIVDRGLDSEDVRRGGLGTGGLALDPLALDLGCGTGLDALWLAERGFHVRGFDASAEMVDQARRRVATAGVHTSVEQRDLGEDRALGEPASATLALANFGVVNCIADLDAFATRLAAVVRPGGLAVLVTMPRHCPSEWLQALVTANPALARRRRDGDATGDYAGLALRYHDAASIVRTFAGTFDVVDRAALGSVAPTFEQRRLVDTRPRVRRFIDRADRLVSPLACRLGVGDHHVIVLERSSS